MRNFLSFELGAVLLLGAGSILASAQETDAKPD